MVDENDEDLLDNEDEDEDEDDEYDPSGSEVFAALVDEARESTAAKEISRASPPVRMAAVEAQLMAIIAMLTHRGGGIYPRLVEVEKALDIEPVSDPRPSPN